MAYAPGLHEGCVEDHVNLLYHTPPEEHDDLLVYDPPQTFGSHQLGEAAEDGAGVAPLAALDEAELLIRWLTFSILESSLRLLIAFMRITMKALRRPRGLRGGLPGPVVWKDCRACVSARFKSTFWKRVSRVSRSSLSD